MKFYVNVARIILDLVLFYASEAVGTTGNSLLTFNSEVDEGSHFNGRYRFVSPRTSKYFITFSGAASNRNSLTLSPTNVQPPLQLIKNSDNNRFNTFSSRDGIVAVNALNEVSLDTSSYASIFQSTSRPDLTSFGMFDIDQLMSDPDYFFIARSSPFSGSTYINFPEIHTSATQLNSNSRYICDREGPMFIFASVGVPPSSRVQVTISHSNPSGIGTRFYLSMDDTDHDGNDMASRSVMVYCRLGDVISVITNSLQMVIFSDPSIQISLGGFHYTPRYVVEPVAWAGYMRFSTDVSVNQQLLEFQDVLVNTSTSLFDNENVNIPVSGYYLVHFSVGMKAGQSVDVGLFVDGGRRLSSIYSQAADHNGVITLSRSVIVTLNQGDLLSVRTNTDVFSQPDQYQTSFMGMLLYPSNLSQ